MTKPKSVTTPTPISPVTQSMAERLKEKIYKNILRHSPHVSHLIKFDDLAMLGDIAAALTAHTEAALKAEREKGR